MVEEAYWYTGNPWIKDWYEFVGEFRKPTLDNRSGAGPGKNGRGRGHPMHHALQAYRVTGDDSILVNHATSGSFTAAGELYAFSSLKATSWEEGADCESFPPLHWALWLDEAVLE